MLRASASTPHGPLILCGLTEGNLDRLKAGQPIRADFASFGLQVSGMLSIIYGTTEADIEQTLKAAGVLNIGKTIPTDERLVAEAELRAQHKHILIATVGLPRSGKSTWAAKTSYPVVSPDAIRLALHGQRYRAESEPMVWAMAQMMVRSLFLAGHKHVVLDATNVTAKRRDEWRSKEWGLFFKHIPTPKDVCLERAAASNDDEIKPIIERMAATFEPLSADERVWP